MIQFVIKTQLVHYWFYSSPSVNGESNMYRIEICWILSSMLMISTLSFKLAKVKKEFHSFTCSFSLLRKSFLSWLDFKEKNMIMKPNITQHYYTGELDLGKHSQIVSCIWWVTIQTYSRLFNCSPCLEEVTCKLKRLPFN